MTRLSGLAILFLVILRMAIGWQFLYEGLWKLQTQETDRPWTSAGYLKNAQGPFGSHFRELAGDPDDLDWLDADHVAVRWNEWREQFLETYKSIDETQQRRLDEMLDGKSEFVAELDVLPDGVAFQGDLGNSIRYDAERKRLIVDGERHLTPSERARLLEMVAVEEVKPGEFAGENEIGVAFAVAVDKVDKRASRLSYKEQLAALLKGDPERVGPVYKARTADGEEIVEERMGEIELYRKLLARYTEDRAKAKQTFQHEHLEKQREDIQSLRAKLVGPVKALDSEFKDKATRLLTARQLAAAEMSQPLTTLRKIDMMTMFGLTILGALLLFGLFSRTAAFGGAVLLASFYLAMPPWPGVIGFQELPGPEHSYLVDKNLIEVLALLAIASLPTGRWFGVDALISRLFTKPHDRQG